MGQYLEISKRINAGRRQIPPLTVLTCERSEIGEVRPIEVPGRAESVYETLVAIHAGHKENLRTSGIDGIARVLLADWRQACGLDELTFWDVMTGLEASGQIIREHGHARPNPNGEQA
jgi:hypothetical protein